MVGDTTRARMTSRKVVETDPTGKYERYNEELGRGAYKSVYLAFDKDDAIEVAWNKLVLNRLSDVELKKVSREVELLQPLRHNNIIRCFASWEAHGDNGQKCVNFITEYVISGRLKDYITRARAIKLKVIRRWAYNILDAINYLHTQDPPIMHRDLKCDNIFVNGHVGEVKIGDLGLSSCKTEEKANTVIGTPEFMAPELYEEEYTEKVDVYAFGMCLLEMITMEYPYAECQNPAQIFRKVHYGIPPKALERIRDGDLKNVIVSCLNKEAERPSAAELLELAVFKDYESDDSDLTNLHLLRDVVESPISSTVSSEVRPSSIGTAMGPVYHHAGVLNRDVLITRTQPSSSNNEAPALQPPVEQGEMMISVHIPIEGTMKKIEFGYDPETDNPTQLANEVVEEFSLDQSHMATIKSEIEGQIKKSVSAGNGLEQATPNDASPSNSSNGNSRARSTAQPSLPGSVSNSQPGSGPASPEKPQTDISVPQAPPKNGNAIEAPDAVAEKVETTEKVSSQEKPNDVLPQDASHVSLESYVPVSNGSQSSQATESLPSSSQLHLENGRKSEKDAKRQADRDEKKRHMANMSLIDYAANGRLDKVKTKIQAGADPKFADYDYRTPLHLAASEGHLDVVEFLLDQGADIDAVDRWGSTPVHDAKKNGRTAVLQLFATRGAVDDIDDDDGQDPEIIRGRELLDYSAKGNEEMVKACLVSGADANYADYDQRTALHLAASEGQVAVAELLLLNGASFKARDRFGRTPVDDARKNGHKGVLVILEKYGAKLATTLTVHRTLDEKGFSLIDAAAKGEADVIARLLQGGAPPLYRDYDRRTALHLAASEGHIDAARVLLAKGADPWAPDRFGGTPVDEASRNGHVELKKILETSGKPSEVKSSVSGATTPSIRAPSPLVSPPGSTLMTPPPTPLESGEARHEDKTGRIAMEAASALARGVEVEQQVETGEQCNAKTPQDDEKDTV